MATKYLEFTPDDAADFVKKYNEAAKDEVGVFKWRGNEFLTSYAYYVIEYLVIRKVIAGKFDNGIFKSEANTIKASNR